MQRVRLLLELKRLGIIRNDRVSTKAKSQLLKQPMVLQKLVEYTSFLHYDASPVERLHVVQQNIVTQPTCKACNGIVKMRTSGRYRATFPTYCSARCLSNQETVKEKRKATNLQRYGNPFAIASTVCREKAKQKWLENYGVDNPAKADVVKQKRKQMLLDR